MSEAPVIRLLVSAVFRDGRPLYNETPVPTMIRAGEKNDRYAKLELVLAVPAADVEDLINGLRYGDAELLIEGMPAAIELETVRVSRAGV